MNIKQLHDNLSSFLSNYDKITDDFHNDHAPDFIDLNIEAMDAGEDSQGNKTPEYANPEYAQLKASIGGNSSNWDFRFHGDLRDKMQLKDGSIFSTDPKTPKLLKYVPDMFGVQQKRLTPYLKSQYLPDFVNLLNKSIFTS